jgi:hypothetical protein
VRAKKSVYKTSFATVWNAVTAEVHREVMNMRKEDAISGDIESEWKLIERKSADTITTEKSSAPPGYYIRYTVTVRGGGPWRVRVDAEAGEYVQGNALMQPIRRGSADEPAWLQARINGLTMAIHARLKAYAVVVEEKPVEAGPKSFETKLWPDLPPAAAQTVARVHDAAKRAAANDLRPLLARDFVWSLAAEPGADGALIAWNADPQILRNLAKLLAAGCGLRQRRGEGDDANLIACPAGATPDSEDIAPRAGFAHIGGVWRFAWYLGGR